MQRARLELERHQLDLRYAHLRLRRESVEQRLVGSLATCGQQVPIVVVVAEPGRYRVIDGFRRLRALERLGEDTVWATVWELEEVEALLLVRGLRSTSESAIEQAWLLAELTRSFSLSGEELARRFDRSASWVSRRLALVQVLPAQVQEAVRDGRVVPHVAMRHLVPLARAKSGAVCSEVAAAIGRERLNSRETAELVALLRRASSSRWSRILADPRLALQARRRSVDPDAGALAWIREVEGLAMAIERLHQRRPGLEPTERRRAREALATARGALAALDEAVGDAPC